MYATAVVTPKLLRTLWQSQLQHQQTIARRLYFAMSWMRSMFLDRGIGVAESGQAHVALARGAEARARRVVMPASVSSLSKNSQLPTPSGVLHQIYGLFTAPYTVNPAASRPSLITRALLR